LCGNAASGQTTKSVPRCSAATVSIVGNEISQTQGVLAKLFEALTPIPIRMVSYGGSKHNVSLLIPSSYKVQTLQLLNKGLFGLE